MVVFPKITYLFQNLPIFHTSSFKMLDSIIRPFIWVYEPPFILEAHLQKHMEKAGLGLPVFRNIIRPVMLKHGYSGIIL